MNYNNQINFWFLALTICFSCKQSEKVESNSSLFLFNQIDSLYEVLDSDLTKFDSLYFYRTEVLRKTSDSLKNLVNIELTFLNSIQDKHRFRVLLKWDIKAFNDRYKNHIIELKINELVNKLNESLIAIDKSYNPNDFKFVSDDTSFFYDKMDVPMMKKYFDFLLHATGEAEKSVLLKIVR